MYVRFFCSIDLFIFEIHISCEFIERKPKNSCSFYNITKVWICAFSSLYFNITYKWYSCFFREFIYRDSHFVSSLAEPFVHRDELSFSSHKLNLLYISDYIKYIIKSRIDIKNDFIKKYWFIFEYCYYIRAKIIICFFLCTSF